MVILIIEDDISILRGLKDNLTFEGYQVHYVHGRTGRFNRMPLDTHVDLLLLDIMLPGMNGYEICRRLKKEKPELADYYDYSQGNRNGYGCRTGYRC